LKSQIEEVFKRDFFWGTWKRFTVTSLLTGNSKQKEILSIDLYSKEKENKILGVPKNLKIKKLHSFYQLWEWDTLMPCLGTS
jgi:hypothetical protein